MGDYFPPQLVARANGGLNVLQFGWAFIVQYGTGLILERWPVEAGHHPLIAYQAAFGLNVLLQLAALAWFAVPRFQSRKAKGRTPAILQPACGWSSAHAPILASEAAILEADEHLEW